MKDLVEKIVAQFAEFEKRQEPTLKTETRPQAPVPVRRLLNLKNS